MKTIIINVFGRVQGVGFRMFAFNSAKKNNIVGSVENSFSNPKIVEIYAQGSDSDICAFLKEIENGPALSRISNITSSEINLEKFHNFIIK